MSNICAVHAVGGGNEMQQQQLIAMKTGNAAAACDASPAAYAARRHFSTKSRSEANLSRVECAVGDLAVNITPKSRN